MNLVTQFGRVLVVACAFLTLGACRPIDAAFDCDTICTRYKDCFDGSYDVAACADRCRGKAEDTNDFYRSVDRCESCIDDRACASATFSCSSDCSEVVP
jgi:hypothetical protein